MTLTKWLKPKESNQAIGLQIQERVAIELEQFFPSPEYKIVSNGTHGADLTIYDKNDIKLFECEVKTAIECFHLSYKRKDGKMNHGIRRGHFAIKPFQLDSDFWAFVVRFTDTTLFWNGDIEIWWALGGDVENYLSKQTLNCMNYKLGIDKMDIIGATLDFNIIKQLLFNNNC